MGKFAQLVSSEPGKFPKYLRIKVAVVIVAILRYEYPQKWSNFFVDLVRGLKNGLGHVDFFMRILQALDQDIIGFDEQRTKDMKMRVNAIKDHMRKNSIPEIVHALIKIVNSMAKSQSDFAKRAVELIREYSAWIPVEIITSKGFLQQIYAYINDGNLRCAAVDVLNEVIQRRNIEPHHKIKIIQQTKVLDLLSSVRAADREYTEALARLADSIATVCIAACRYMDTKAREALQAKGEDLKRLATISINVAQKSILLFLKFAQHPDFSIAEQGLDCMDSYIHFLHHVERFASVQISKEQKHLLNAMIELQIVKMAYPNNFDSYDEEVEEDFDRFRMNLENQIVNLVRFFPKITMSVVLRKLHMVIRNLRDVRPQIVEATMRAFFRSHEALSLEERTAFKKTGLKTTMDIVMQSNVGESKNSKLSVTYLETLVRYAGFLERSPGYLKPVLMSFLDHRGMGNPSEEVRGRSCYLFFRLLHTIPQGQRKMMTNLIPQLLRALQQRIFPILERGLATGERARVPLTVSNSLFICESMGILCSSNFAGKDGPTYFTQCNTVFRDRVVKLAKESRAFKGDPQLAGDRLSDIIKMLATLTKPVTRDAKYLEKPLASCLETVLMVFKALPAHPKVHQSTISVLHQMLLALKSRVVPPVTQALVILCGQLNTENYLQASSLIVQVIGLATQDQQKPLLTHLLPVYFHHTKKVLGSFKFIDEKERAYGSHIQERDDILKRFLNFVRRIIVWEVFLFNFQESSQKMSYSQVLQTVLEGCRRSDLNIVKTCLGILSELTKKWIHISKKVESLRRFLIVNVTKATLEAIFSKYMDISDAQGARAMTEIVKIHRNLASCYNKEYLSHLHNMMSRSNVPNEIVRQYVYACNPSSSQSPGETRSYLMKIVRASKTVGR
eukprot:CAMPEP_0167743760 /NCGR_PEP_ID=MMETSP0110_2-20121227/2193_1 /TAXON_ID=629695 /ORGANISM="Gymnochlora sp., Strain CCMP2014" /LENGTH=901 /DNA_ID=CAMNT_0007628163 /DNA_START=310 /DNA_END=3015 /DNA_ORIENTATION=+